MMMLWEFLEERWNSALCNTFIKSTRKIIDYSLAKFVEVYEVFHNINEMSTDDKKSIYFILMWQNLRINLLNE